MGRVCNAGGGAHNMVGVGCGGYRGVSCTPGF